MSLPLRIAGLTLGLVLAGCQTVSVQHESGQSAPRSGASSVQGEYTGLPNAHTPARSPTTANGSGSPGDVDLPPTDLWARIRRGLSMPALEDSLVEPHAQRQASRQFFAQRAERSRRYLFLIVEEVEKRGLPLELALLPFVESALNPDARSPVGATGLWQFMAPSARDYDLRVNPLVDDRKHLLQATRAALDYLTRLHTRFGDWHLALASYNWGEGRVQRAMDRNRARGLPVDFASLSVHMPEETRLYVPQLLALARLVQQPQRYAVQLPALPNKPYLVRVPLPADIDFERAVRFSGLGEQGFRAFNPSARPPLLMRAAIPEVLLPVEAAESFQQALKGHRQPLSSWTVTRLAHDQRVETLAASHGVGADTLRRVNGIPRGMKPLGGSTLLIPAQSDDSVPAAMLQKAVLSFAPDVVRLNLPTRQGDTLLSVAKRLDVSLQRVADANPGLSRQRRLGAGTTISLTVSTEQGENVRKSYLVGLAAEEQAALAQRNSTRNRLKTAHHAGTHNRPAAGNKPMGAASPKSPGSVSANTRSTAASKSVTVTKDQRGEPAAAALRPSSARSEAPRRKVQG